jgi:hypothetical protein
MTLAIIFVVTCQLVISVLWIQWHLLNQLFHDSLKQRHFLATF